MTLPIETLLPETSRLRMSALSCGERSNPLVIFLHGFPELSDSWREVLPAVAAAGFWAVAPDLRGYGGTDRPADGYDLDSLAADIAALIQSLGHEKAHVVGHDWGGAIAYQLAARHPERVDRLTVLNCPHPLAMARGLRRFSQLRRSWYIVFFQLPWLPEFVLSRNGASAVTAAIRSLAVSKDNFTAERLAPFAANMAAPGAARAALAYYRAMFRGLLDKEKRSSLKNFPRIRAPFLLIWGEEDQALGMEMIERMERYFEGPYERRLLPGVGHSVPMEAPERAAALIVEHLTGTGTDSRANA